MGISGFVKRHAIASYCALVFVISWGSALLVLGPSGFIGAESTNAAMRPIVYVGLAGPTVAGIVLTSIVHGRTGLGDLFRRWVHWRVGAYWYAIALLTAPALTLLTQLALSMVWASFMPGIGGSGPKLGLVAAGIGAALVVAAFEETGWTGFAIPAFRKQYSVLTTGLIVGVIWGLWHFPMFSGSAPSSGFAPALFLAVILFAWLPAYRVFMVWIYDHTQSVLLAILAHAPITFLSLLLIPTKPGVTLTFDLIYGAELWILALVLIYAPRALIRRRPHALAT